MSGSGSGEARATPTGVAWREVRDAAVRAVGRGWPVVPGTCRPDDLGFSQVCPLEASRRRGRHRRARGDWWRELLWPGTVVALTVPQALRQGERERGSAPTTRRVPGVPHQGTVPLTAVAGAVTVGERGSPHRGGSRPQDDGLGAAAVWRGGW